jgi:hypothetical protein
MTTTFKITPGRPPTAGRLVYQTGDFAFATIPRPTGCVSSVSINELELMLDEETQRVVFVTGYCPRVGWQPDALQVPTRRAASLVAVLQEEAVPGTSIPLNDGRWPVLVDWGSGWIRLGRGDPSDDHAGVEFAPGAVAILKEGELIALWLKPDLSPRGA